MVEPTFEKKDALGGMEIYPGGRGAILDLSDDVVRKIEESERTKPTPKPAHDILFGQLDPEEREALGAFGEFTAGTPRPTELTPDVEVVGDREDVRLEQEALQAYYDGRTDLCIEYFSKIKDKEKIYDHLETITTELVASRDFENALKIAELIANPEQREQELVYVKSQQAKYAPTATGDLEDGDREALEADFGQNPDEGRKVNIRFLNKTPEVIKLLDEDEWGINTKKESQRDMKVFPDVDAEYAVSEPTASNSDVPPPIPETTVSAPEVPPVPNTPEKSESVEANLEALRVARDAYATAYTEWEYQTRNSTKLWNKTMFALGASKPAPERLTLRTTELEDAREEYLKARVMCGKATTNTYQENYFRATDEALLLDDAISRARDARKNSDESDTKMRDEMIEKTAGDKFVESLRKAKNKWIGTPGKRTLLASTLVAGGTLFAGAGLGGAALAGGMRVARAGLGILGAEGTGLGLGNYFNRKNEENAELDLKEYAGNINAENFPEWEAKQLEQFENNVNIKRRQNTIKKAAMVAVGGATAMGSGGVLNSIFGHPVTEALHVPGTDSHSTEMLQDKSHFGIVENKEAVGNVSGVEALQNADTSAPMDLEAEIYALKVDILSKYHGSVVPDAIQKNILDVPTEKLLEKMHLVDVEHNASGDVSGGHMLFENGKVVFEKGGLKSDLYDPNIEVGKKPFSAIDFGGNKKITPDGTENLLGDPVTTADELKVTDPALGVEHVSSPEPVMVDESHLNIDSVTSGHEEMGETVLEQSFEGDKISVLHGTPSDPDRISMTFGGKEFAVGSLKNGVPKLEILPQYKGGWFTSTVYERAYDVMKSRIKPELWNTK